MGSPPRMRGKQFSAVFCAFRKRITPADAGKTLKVLQLNNLLKDHPRGCGENVPVCFRKQQPHGSPPRMRGKPETPVPVVPADRITPADAGKTYSHAITISQIQDHPRGCGENTACRCGALGSSGSPPRMRGKRSANGISGYAVRITPADAGKTRSIRP